MVGGDIIGLSGFFWMTAEGQQEVMTRKAERAIAANTVICCLRGILKRFGAPGQNQPVGYNLGRCAKRKLLLLVL